VVNLFARMSIIKIAGQAVNVTAPEAGASHGKAKCCAEGKKTHGVVVRDKLDLIDFL